MGNSLYQYQPPPLLTHLNSSKWYVYAVLCRSSGSGRLPGTNRWFWAPSTTAFSTVEFGKKPMVSRKEFCAMDVVSFLPNQPENWQRKPDFQISIGIESSFLLCNFVDTKPTFCIMVLCFYIFVLHLHLLMRLEIVLCQKALLIIFGFTSSFPLCLDRRLWAIAKNQ